MMASDPNPADTPLLLIAWRRPHTLRQVINAIRPVAPKRLFVACDGPNSDRPGEAEKVAATRQVIEQEIDWPCQINRLFSDVNQGCGLGPIRAITWFFEQVEEGIILEDDCVPHPDFFPYCTSLLDRYRYDTRIWCITGDNSVNISFASPDYSYAFIRYPLIWGWATWRRCWDSYLINFEYMNEIQSYDEYLAEGFRANLDLARTRFKYWEAVRNGHSRDIWDAAWAYTCLINSGMTVIPSANLVCNVGFGPDATHTVWQADNRNAASFKAILPIRHPPFFIRDNRAEEQFEAAIYGYQPSHQSPLALKLMSLFDRAKIFPLALFRRIIKLCS